MTRHECCWMEPQSSDWEWPRAALAIILLSLLLWAGVEGVASHAFG